MPKSAQMVNRFNWLIACSKAAFYRIHKEGGNETAQQIARRATWLAIQQWHYSGPQAIEFGVWLGHQSQHNPKIVSAVNFGIAVPDNTSPPSY